MKSEELTAIEAGLHRYPLVPVELVKRLVLEIHRLQAELAKSTQAS